MSERQRSAYRSVLTKEVKLLEELLNNKAELDTILARKSTFTSTYEKLANLDEQILTTLMSGEDTDEDAIVKEITSANEYTTKYHEVSIRIQNLQSVQSPDNESCHNESVKSLSNKIRLPKIELKRFDGELKNWIGFWSQFVKIHNDDSLGEEDKFSYLLQSMKIDSPPYKLIEGFPASKENYGKAIDLLRSRFGKDELLIEYYVRELLSLVLKREDNLSVTFLYDKLEVQLRALDSLGVTKDKYAAILFPLVESAIPESVFKVWERHRVVKNASTKEPDSCLSQLFEFLKVEVEAEERLKLRSNKFDAEVKCSEQVSKPTKPVKNKMALPSAAVLVSSSDPDSHKTCLFCAKGSHMSHDCFLLIDMTVGERLEAIKKKGACLRCLKKGHMANKCKGQVKCHICKGKHLSILCQKTEESKPEVENKPKVSVQSTTNSVSAVEGTTYLQTLKAVIDCGSSSTQVRVLCDSGSQKSFISESCAKQLGLRPTGSILMQQELFGGNKTKSKNYKTYNIVLKALESEYKVSLNVLENPVICNQVPQMCDQKLIKTLKDKNIILSDVTYSKQTVSNNIDILIGADAWANIITSNFQKINDQLVAIKTQLGWTVVGTSNMKSSIMSTMFVNTLSSQDVERFWDLETMGILQPKEELTQEEKDKEVLQFFEDTVERKENGRYLVKLPWIKEHPDLQTNRQQAEKRLHSTTRKLHKMNLYVGYDSVFKDWLEKGIIEKVETGNTLQSMNTHYLPHHAVVKEGSSTRIRPVFDASTKDVNGYCVNECLEPGPNLIELIPVVLTHFRKFTFALTSDIEKAFLQISVDPADRDMLRFLWWEDGQIVTYRHARVVFGLSCSPFLLGAVLNRHLDDAPRELQPVAETLKKSFYVDNCLTGVNELQDQDKFIKEAQTLLQQGGFNLRGWAGNGLYTSEEHVENILGLRWFCSRDELCCNTSFLKMKPDKLTKRTLLSCAQKIFDPIGLTAPVALVPKLILQKTWALKTGWDENLPEELQKEYYKWADQLDCLELCTMNRKIFINESSTIHVFSDASKNAFSSCIFLRTVLDGTVHVNLILAKARVAPTKPLSMPRLELMGAVTGVRLYLLALKCLDEPNLPAIFWLDSSVALAWIAKQGKWSVFVENRVKEINNFTKPSQWRHVPGHANPADLLSRGCNSRQLLNSRWWDGPAWLYEPEEEWPSSTPAADTREVDEEKRKTVVKINNTIEAKPTITERLGMRISKYSLIVRTIAWILRVNPKNKFRSEADINSEEFKTSETTLFRLIQEETFQKDLKCKALSGISTFIDEDGIIRLRSRVLNEEDSLEYQYPIILPSSHPIVERMIEQHHKENKHARTQALLVILRERIWILKGRKTINKVIHKCVTCRRYAAAALEVPTPPLPTDRTNISSCFQVSGVDLAGPLIDRNGQKCWVVIFTCAVYRAVHLELIQSLSTEAFLQSLRRFIARRGRVSTIYSDNGTNFTGLSRKLQSLDWKKIQNDLNLKPIVWKFNPPASPWWGGFWERLIKILKGLLKKSLGNASLKYEELNTLICECEGVMNARPLTYVSEESNELKPLTPSMFLQSIQGNDVMDLDILERQHLNSRWKYVQKVREGLKSRFKKEYLGFLRSHKKNRSDVIREGDVVLVHNEDKRRILWPLGLVTKVIPGKDNIVRLVRVKTGSGVLLRPIQRLYPLEISMNEADVLKDGLTQRNDPTTTEEESQPETSTDKNDTNQSQTTTRSGRRVKEVHKLDL